MKRLSDKQLQALEVIGDGLVTVDDYCRHTIKGRQDLGGMNTTTLRSLVERGYLTREVVGERQRTVRLRYRRNRPVTITVYEYRWAPTALGRAARTREVL